VAAACSPFDKPELRDEIESARREREQLIDHINVDQVTFSRILGASRGPGPRRNPEPLPTTCASTRRRSPR
jgi:hypothetical protein